MYVPLKKRMTERFARILLILVVVLLPVALTLSQ
jgi:hypothetical protein